MRLHSGVQTLDFDGLLAAGNRDRNDHGANHVLSPVAVDFPVVLLEFDELWLILKSVEQEERAIVWKAQAWGHLRSLGFFLGALGGCLFIYFNGLGARQVGGAVLLVFGSSRPIH